MSHSFLGQRPPSRPHCHKCLAKGGRVAVEIGRVSVGRAPHLAMDKDDSVRSKGTLLFFLETEPCGTEGVAGQRWDPAVGQRRNRAARGSLLACFDRGGCWPPDRRMQGTVAPTGRCFVRSRSGPKIGLRRQVDAHQGMTVASKSVRGWPLPSVKSRRVGGACARAEQTFPGRSWSDRVE
jgi:hypothetical protein